MIEMKASHHGSQPLPHLCHDVVSILTRKKGTVCLNFKGVATKTICILYHSERSTLGDGSNCDAIELLLYIN